MEIDEVLEQQTEKIEQAVYVDIDKLNEEQSVKEMANLSKTMSMLQNEMNRKEQLKLDREKFEFEKEERQKQIENETRKLDIEEKRVENEKVKVTADIKDQKKGFWLGVTKVLVTLFGTIAGIFLTIWSVTVSMKFEETGSFRSSVGKFAQNFCQKTLAKLDKVKSD